MDRKEVKTLAITAAKARLLAVEAVHRCASGHPGGSLSVLDVLTVLYFHTMRVDPQNPADPDRDRFGSPKGTAPRRSTPRWLCAAIMPWKSWNCSAPSRATCPAIPTW